MVVRNLTIGVLLAVAALGAAAAGAVASPGFKVPSGNTTCAVLPADRVGGEGPGLFCTSTYIKKGAYDGQGAVELRRTGKGKRIGSGNDLSLYVGGYNPDGSSSRRPVLGYGDTWQRKGFSCTSRRSGLTCERGEHGFELARAQRRYF